MSNEWLADGARRVRARRDALPMSARPVITVPGKRHPVITTLTAADRAEASVDRAPASMAMFEVYEGASDYLLLVTSDRSMARVAAEAGDRIVEIEWVRRPLATTTGAQQ